MKILLISQHFPPERSGGIGRPFSLYKYLRNYGIYPVVLTVDAYGKMDGEPDIFRTKSILSWKNKGNSILYNVSRLTKLANFVTPTADRVWEKTSFRKGVEILNSQKIELIYASYPGISALRVGLRLSRRANVPLISEFRDGLIYEPLFRFNPISLFWTRSFEKSLIKASSAVVTIGNELSRYFAGRYALKNAFTVHNGYDRDDFILCQQNTENHRTGKFRVAHFGNLKTSRKDRQSSGLFFAIAKLKKENISPEKFELTLFGRFMDPEKKLIKDLGIDGLVKFHEPVDKKEGFRMLNEDFDALLLVGAKGSKTVITSKLPEYLYLNKPVIGVCKGNEAAEIIERTGTGEACGFDADSIYFLLKKALSGKIAFNPKKEEILKFDRASQAERISEIIKTVIEKKASQPGLYLDTRQKDEL